MRGRALVALTILGLTGAQPVAAVVQTSPQPLLADSATTRLTSTALQISFCALSELTPQNVHALLALASVRVEVSSLAAPARTGAKVTLDSWSVDPRIKEFAFARRHSGAAGANGAGMALSYRLSAEAPGAVRDASAAASRTQLTAWDPVSRRPVWSVDESLPSRSTLTVTAGGLIFYETKDGRLKALDATTGRLLWQHRVADTSDAASLRGPISYRGPNGHQYVAVFTVGAHSAEELHAFALAQ